MRLLIGLMALALLGACSKQDMLQKFSTPADQQAAKDYINRLRTRDFAYIESALDQSMVRPDTADILKKMADKISDQEPTSIKLVGVQNMSTPDSKRVNTTFEYQFGNKWLLINVATLNKRGSKTVVGFNVVSEPGSLESQNRFTLQAKAPFQYSILALAIVMPLFTLYALVICFRTKLPGRKWPWVLFILFGFGKLAVNWSTGQWSLLFLSVQLFSASFMAQLYSPWIVSVSLPVGAIIFLLFRQRRPMSAFAV
jgi:hypothetical protein